MQTRRQMTVVKIGFISQVFRFSVKAPAQLPYKLNILCVCLFVPPHDSRTNTTIHVFDISTVTARKLN